MLKRSIFKNHSPPPFFPPPTIYLLNKFNREYAPIKLIFGLLAASFTNYACFKALSGILTSSKGQK